MNLRQRLSMFFATGLSLLLHALVIWQVMNLTIGGSSQSSLFAAVPERKPEAAMRVFRANEDEIVEEAPLTPAVDAIKPESDAKKVQAQTKKLLETIDASKVLPPKPLSEANLKPDTDLHNDAPSPPGVTPTPGPSRALDTTDKLLRMAQPSIVLPKYVGPTDEIRTPTPGNGAIDPGAKIDVSEMRKLDALLGGSGVAGSGIAGGATNTTGGLASTAPVAPPPIDEPAMKKPIEVAKAAPPKLPDLIKTVTPPTVGPGDDGSRKEPIHLDNDFDYKLRKYYAPPRRTGGLFGLGAQTLEQEPGWFQIQITPKRSLRRLTALHKDVVWVIDTSGSIREKWVEQVKAGVGVSLDSLNPGDRFNLVMFKDTVNVLNPAGLLEANDATRQRARDFLNAAKASGDTDVNRALAGLIVRDVAPDRVYQIILVSDGKPTSGALDPRTIINLITKENDLVAGIYCVGVGDAQDRELLEFLAYRNKGYVVYPDTFAQTAATIRQLAAGLRYPILKDATFDAVGVDTTQIFPRIPRDIYQGESVNLYGRYTPDASKISMRLTGSNSGDVLDFTFSLDFPSAQVGDETIAHQWGFWNLHHLYSEVIRQGPTEELKRRMDELKKRYDLKTTY